jgi:hypothetical protein
LGPTDTDFGSQWLLGLGLMPLHRSRERCIAVGLPSGAG